MVSFSAVVAAAAAVLASTSDAFNLPVGYYYRPNAALVSGVPGNSSSLPFRRSPCPALKSLANHGYLPRSGTNISKTEVRDVVMDEFNVDLTVASTLISVLPDPFDLNLLGTHGLVEHDASLVHADAYFGAEPATIDQPLLNDVLSCATYDKPFTVETFGQLRKEHLATCQASNPNCTFGPRDVFLAFGESMLIVLGFGNGSSETACVDSVKSFLKFERFPSGFQKPELISMQKLLATSAKIQAIANA